MASEKVYCHHCGEIIYTEFVIVSVGDDHVFFHERCYEAWQEEEKAERNRQKELWEFFG